MSPSCRQWKSSRRWPRWSWTKSRRQTKPKWAPRMANSPTETMRRLAPKRARPMLLQPELRLPRPHWQRSRQRPRLFDMASKRKQPKPPADEPELKAAEEIAVQDAIAASAEPDE